MELGDDKCHVNDKMMLRDALGRSMETAAMYDSAFQGY